MQLFRTVGKGWGVRALKTIQKVTAAVYTHKELTLEVQVSPSVELLRFVRIMLSVCIDVKDYSTLLSLPGLIRV